MRRREVVLSGLAALGACATIREGSLRPSPPKEPLVRTLRTGLAMGESPRWHDGRLWICDWGAQEILTIGPGGRSVSSTPAPFGLPFCIDWLHDGRLLIVAGREGRLVRRELDGSFVTHATLGDGAWNEIVVDGRGNIYINGGSANGITLVKPDHSVHRVADGLAFPNGMAVSADNRTLIVAESLGNRLTAFDIATDGSLSKRRVWAALGDGVPDGICLDAEGAAWYADVPNKRCVRVREGGHVLQSIAVDRGCFACMLGGPRRKTLFVIAAEWRGMERIAEVAAARTGQVLAIDVSVPGVGWP